MAQRDRLPIQVDELLRQLQEDMRAGELEAVRDRQAEIDSLSEWLANTSMTIWFELGPTVEVEVGGHVIDTHDDPANMGHSHRIAFSALSDVDRESILTYIVEARRGAIMAHDAAIRA